MIAVFVAFMFYLFVVVGVTIWAYADDVKRYNSRLADAYFGRSIVIGLFWPFIAPFVICFCMWMFILWCIGKIRK